MKTVYGLHLPAFLFMFAAGWCPHLAAGAEPAGTVVAIRGDVHVTRADRTNIKLGIKDDIQQKDVVQTGRRGRVQILFTDDTILSLGRNTQIEITECVFKRSEGQGALRLSIREGAFRIVGGAILKIAPENFSADTPTATIGVRGSSFGAEVSPTLTTVVLFATTGGGIVVSNDQGYRIVYIPGSGVTVRLGERPGAVEDMDELAKRLLGLTAVGGAPDEQPPDEPGQLPPADQTLPAVEPADLEDPQGAGVDPHGTIPAYRTGREARDALAAALDDGSFPMSHGNAVALDLTYGWALRTLEPDDAWFVVALSGRTLTAVEEGHMILHAEGTGDSADTFPAGPVSTPAIPFYIRDGAMVGNEAIEVVDSDIRPPATRVDVSNWGWWEMDIADPNGIEPPHHVAGLWQGTALMQTAEERVSEHLLGANVVGHYDGAAQCLENGVDRYSGTSAFTLDFRDRSFEGTLDFQTDGGPEMHLDGNVHRHGIHGRISHISTESGTISSSMRGFFYGDDARELQGAFDAQSAANRFIGIFDAGGDISPAAPAPSGTAPTTTR